MDASFVCATGETVWIDAADLVEVMRYRWRVGDRGYVLRSADTTKTKCGKTTLRLHRFLMGEPAGLEVDHIDLDPLNNRRSNLRVATRQQNAGNAPVGRRGSTGYKGVHLVGRRYYAAITVDDRAIRLGTFATVEDAARAYDDAARQHFGAFARLNFPVLGERGCRDGTPGISSP